MAENAGKAGVVRTAAIAEALRSMAALGSMITEKDRDALRAAAEKLEALEERAEAMAAALDEQWGEDH